MKVLSVNVGGPRDLEVNGEIVRTSFYKSPVTGPVAVHQLNFVGEHKTSGGGL